MIALTIFAAVSCAAVWTCLLGDIFGWWRTPLAMVLTPPPHPHALYRSPSTIIGVQTVATPEDIADAWLSLTNEQRSELLAERRKQQLDEQAAQALPPAESQS
ncbi:hypothetical protein ACFOWZ_44490 [Lentzea rhizosphaerae]|uniref:Uncharacterized protein n=1 Tax=Lentzea rhizosphaerae TaxID=2041025 RepID=A0ABV8C9L3_9PSEU